MMPFVLLLSSLRHPQISSCIKLILKWFFYFCLPTYELQILNKSWNMFFCTKKWHNYKNHMFLNKSEDLRITIFLYLKLIILWEYYWSHISQCAHRILWSTQCNLFIEIFCQILNNVRRGIPRGNEVDGLRRGSGCCNAYFQICLFGA